MLVNRATASAAEIVAGALQDHDRALVLGRPTYGKGSAQSVFSFHDAAGVKLTTARWFTPAGRNIEYLPPGARDTAPGAPRDSSGRPVFKTDSGRKVFGGGGIVPDVLSGDSVSFPTAARVLFTAVGPNVRKLRAAVTVEARRLAKRGVSGPMFDVTADMRGDVYQELVRSGVTVDRPLFDNAADWLDRALGGETVRYAYGRQAETRRLVLSDRVVQEAATKLKSARTTRELLGSTFEP